METESRGTFECGDPYPIAYPSLLDPSSPRGRSRPPAGIRTCTTPSSTTATAPRRSIVTSSECRSRSPSERGGQWRLCARDAPERDLARRGGPETAGSISGRRGVPAARSNNESGYFELKELVYLNNDILAYYGGSWDDVPELPPGWEKSDELAYIRDGARVLLERHFADSPLWGWKDPRTCITLPFWQRLVPGLRYVICVRNRSMRPFTPPARGRGTRAG